MPLSPFHILRAIPHGLFSLFFPDDCHLCHQPLTGITRVPVCDDCLREPEPLSADFFCVSCRTPFQNEFPLDAHGQCALCRSGLRGFDAAYCFGSYDGKLRDLIHLFKYRRMKPLAGSLEKLMAAALPRDLQFDAIVSVPMHWRKRFARGFNQADLLARGIAHRCGIPVIQSLVRRKSTQVQAGLSHAQRRLNVSSAFSIRRNATLTGLRILLIDDVMTTGATGSACAFLLKRGGAKSVTLLTLARVDRRWAENTAGAEYPGAS